MTNLELTGFVVLWLILAALTSLLALLYRQVERAYRKTAAIQAAGLLAGNVAPDLEVLTSAGVEPLALPDTDEIAVVAFVTPECDACRSLLAALADRISGVDRALALVHGETTPELRTAMDRVEIHWLASPGDAVRDFGVTIVPLVYILRGRTILNSGTVASAVEVEELVEQGLRYEAADASELAVVEGQAAR